MLAKLKLEWGEFCFWRKLVIHALISVIAAYVHLDGFRYGWQGASVGEYVVYSLTNKHYFLVLFPFLCLAWTSGKNSEMCRYPLLLRYRDRREFFVVRFLARGAFLLAALAVHIGALLVVGRSLPAAPQMVFVPAGNLAGIIVRQFLNLCCYVCMMFLLHEILSDVVGNVVLDVLLTVSISLLNLMVVKLHMQSVVAWTPWGNIAYELFGRTREGYHFYGFYWLSLIGVLFWAADWLNGRKDYVFEEMRKVG